jgi:hypothetical protein
MILRSLLMTDLPGSVDPERRSGGGVLGLAFEFGFRGTSGSVLCVNMDMDIPPGNCLG